MRQRKQQMSRVPVCDYVLAGRGVLSLKKAPQPRSVRGRYIFIPQVSQQTHNLVRLQCLIILVKGR